MLQCRIKHRPTQSHAGDAPFSPEASARCADPSAPPARMYRLPVYTVRRPVLRSIPTTPTTCRPRLRMRTATVFATSLNPFATSAGRTAVAGSRFAPTAQTYPSQVPHLRHGCLPLRAPSKSIASGR